MLQNGFLLLWIIGCSFLVHACAVSDKPQFESPEVETTSRTSDPFVGASQGEENALAFPQFVPQDTVIEEEVDAEASASTSSSMTVSWGTN